MGTGFSVGMIGLHIGTLEHEIHEARSQRSFSRDFTLFREPLLMRGITLVSVHNGRTAMARSKCVRRGMGKLFRSGTLGIAGGVLLLGSGLSWAGSPEPDTQRCQCEHGGRHQRARQEYHGHR
jgi:hypothetical protein